MTNFTKYLTEDKTSKNLHLTHLEDSVYIAGAKGAQTSIAFLESLGDMLSGNSKNKISSLSVKWDGAPAIFSGIDPEDGKFFVSSKGLFNKNPKINKTQADIDKNHSGGLAEKLKIALKELPALGIKGVIQGDMMYTKDDLSEKSIDGEKMLTFQPNTIVYAIPTNSDLAKTIRKSNIGVVWHTQYTGGKNLASFKASPLKSVKNLKKTSKVWFKDAAFEDRSGNVTFTSTESKNFKEVVNKAKQSVKKLGNKGNDFSNNDQLTIDFQTFNNSLVRAGEQFPEAGKHVSNFFKFYNDKHLKIIDKLKTEKNKNLKNDSRVKGLEILRSQASNIKLMFQVMKDISEAKQILIDKLNKIDKLEQTFIRTKNGFKATSGEGFVAVDHVGNSIKLVDRLEFSFNNFNAIKAWTR